MLCREQSTAMRIHITIATRTQTEECMHVYMYSIRTLGMLGHQLSVVLATTQYHKLQQWAIKPFYRSL